MDYGGLVKRALDIMWKFKYLWVFGFFLEFGSGTGGWFGNLSERCELPVGDFISGALVGAIIFLVLVGLLLFLVFLIMYLISQGGLIHCVWKIESGEKPTLRDGWNAGIRNFWRILGISILILIFILGSGIITLGPFVILIIAPSLVMGLIGIGSTMIYVLGFVIVGLLLALPFVALGLINLFLGIFLGAVVGLVYIGLASALWGTYIDSLWTMAYLDMKKLQQQPATAS
jgi:hypothetical protein